MRRNKHTRESIIILLQQFYELHQRSPTLRDAIIRSTTAKMYFGNFVNALIAAGLPFHDKHARKKQPKRCEVCDKEFYAGKPVQRYCSVECAHVPTKKPSVKPKLSREQWKQQKEENRRKYLTCEFEEIIGWDQKRLRVIHDQKNCCNKCGISEWQGQKIVFEVDHIDGNRYNNNRENLEALCPNCHSLTPTWRGRNKENAFKKMTDDEILDAYEQCKNIRQTLIKLGLAPKGGNYQRIQKLIEKNINKTVD